MKLKKFKKFVQFIKSDPDAVLARGENGELCVVFGDDRLITEKKTQKKTVIDSGFVNNCFCKYTIVLDTEINEMVKLLSYEKTKNRFKSH